MCANGSGVSCSKATVSSGTQEYNNFQLRQKFHVSLVVLKQTSLNPQKFTTGLIHLLFQIQIYL